MTGAVCCWWLDISFPQRQWFWGVCWEDAAGCKSLSGKCEGERTRRNANTAYYTVQKWAWVESSSLWEGESEKESRVQERDGCPWMSPHPTNMTNCNPHNSCTIRPWRTPQWSAMWGLLWRSTWIKYPSSVLGNPRQSAVKIFFSSQCILYMSKCMHTQSHI